MVGVAAGGGDTTDVVGGVGGIVVADTGDGGAADMAMMDTAYTIPARQSELAADMADQASFLISSHRLKA